MTRTIQHLNWAALGANLGSALLFTLLLLSPFLWGAPLWHWLLAVAIALVLGLYFYVRREHYEEPGPDAWSCPAFVDTVVRRRVLLVRAAARS